MQSLYIMGAEPDSGKSVVSLGIMEILAAVNRRIGFFRPVVPEPAGDDLTSLILQRYGLDLAPDLLFGCTAETARRLSVEGRYETLLKLILDKFKRLEEASDMVVCVGTDFSRVAPALTFDFNADLANNLGCLSLPVLSGSERTLEQTLDAMGLALESLGSRGCDLLAMVVNRVPEPQLGPLRQRARPLLPESLLLYALPEHPSLGHPTVSEVVRRLGAVPLAGGDDHALTQLVGSFRVAAMEVPHFLDYVDDGCLIITPGDRSDIILASLLADESTGYPRVAGLLLTGGMDPAPQLLRLLEGRDASKVPVFRVPDDTFTTSLAVSQVRPTLLPGDERKIAAALGLADSHIDAGELRQRLALRHSKRITPLMFEYELVRRARSRRRHIVLPEGLDERILRAAEILALRDVAELTLLGEPERIWQQASELGLNVEQVAVIDPLDSEWRETFANEYYELRRHKGLSWQMAYDAMADVSYFGTMMVHMGMADGMVSGAAHTTQQTIRPAFEIIRTRPGVKLVSSVFLMCLPDQVLVYGDCAVNPNPDAEQLADIAVTSAETARMFGIEPRVAMLSYSTGESGKGADVERVRAAVRIARERAPELKLEGPIQYDAAVDTHVARSKLPGSEVAGHASVFIFPDLNTGNNTYKAVQRSAGAVAIGPVLQGLNKPVNDLSRGCTVTDIVNTVAITAIQAQGDGGQGGA
ncbi:MAG TPA: phosphate acetyltransferase [Sedimenticola thiotaurini]|uniref:Phosphate acetyltransferase n=1 Tax=Sedimenticola thiotaurini TaxID=1543721 RepID=A0A831W721_9GAMM|nr:phosphate acetyltransferase [Sedimenticola thiotaurini]